MPTEIRRLVFTNDELQTALSSAATKTKKTLPIGSITSAAFKRFGETEVQVEFYDNRENQSTTATFDSSFVGSALIFYCVNEHIPIPRAAAKSLDISGNNLSLVLRLDSDPGGGSFPIRD